MDKVSQIYAICKHKEKEEYHIFRTKIVNGEKCFFSNEYSVCNLMTIHDRSCCVKSCSEKDEIQEKAKELGDSICNDCLHEINNLNNKN